MLPPRVSSASHLITSSEATIAGFIDQAQSKAVLAKPHIQDALRLSRVLESVNDVRILVEDEEVRYLLLAAVGLSDKAARHLPAEVQIDIVREALGQMAAQGGADWRQELLLRFALTRGDSLGGTSRNLAGAKAKDEFADAVLRALDAPEVEKSAKNGRAGARKIQSVKWKQRVMVFDRKPKLVGNNIDVVVLQTAEGMSIGQLLEEKDSYVACGEVKGGIDPAGADEHWKTAHSALERIRRNFGLRTPALFFVGAAIAKSMAHEIIAQLRDNRLTYAANLTVPGQVEDLADWLVSL